MYFKTILYNEKYIYIKKYFLFIKSLNTKFNKFNNLKIFDLKKKFIKNLYEFKNYLNIFLLKKKVKNKSNLKFFKYFYKYFKYNKFFFEYSVINLILKLKYIYNYSDFYYLINIRYIFINRNVIFKKYICLINYFNILEFVFNKLYINYLIKIYALYKLKKKKKRIYKFYWNFYVLDVFNKSYFFENCYKTGTIILILKDFTFFFISNYLSYYINYYLIKLYLKK